MPGSREKLRGLLGLARRAGALRSGTENTLSAVRAMSAGLVLLDGAASGNTRKRIGNACAAYHAPLAELESGLLGDAVGSPGSITACIAPGSFADAVRNLLRQDTALHDSATDQHEQL